MAQAIPMMLMVAGAAMSFKSQSEAASAQKDAARGAQRLAEMNARNQERESERELENMSRAQAKEQSFNRAKAFASGISEDDLGSMGLALDEQKQVNQEEFDWTKLAGQNEAAITRQGGQNAYDSGKARAKSTQSGAYASLLSGAGNVYGAGKTAGYWGS